MPRSKASKSVRRASPSAETRSVPSASTPAEATSARSASTSAEATSARSASAEIKATPGSSASPPDKATAVGSMSSKDQEMICKLVADLISVGSNPPIETGTKNTWDPRELAKWYGRCAWLSALLSAALGDSNVWKSILTGWDSTKPADGEFHTVMLGTLDAIQHCIGCPQEPLAQ